MLRRLLAAVAIAAGVAPIGVASAAAAPAAPATTGTICVALVVDARSIGGPVSEGCITVKKGATGVDVLDAAHDSLTFRADGLICAINGLPKTGCSAVDDTHYWAYYHRAPGSATWSYSNEGAGTYQPVNASTEGWVYDDGTDLMPDNIPYSSICKTKATPSPIPTSSARQSTKATPAPHRSATASTTTHPAVSASAQPHHRPKPHPLATATRLRLPVLVSTSPPLAAPSPAESTAAASSGSASGGHGTVVGVVVAAVIVAGLGAGAAVARRRRSVS